MAETRPLGLGAAREARPLRRARSTRSQPKGGTGQNASRYLMTVLAQPSLNQSPIALQNVEKTMEKSYGKVARSGLE